MMSAKKLSPEEYDGSADLGPVITRTIKKTEKAEKAPSKKAAPKKAEVEQTREEFLQECGVLPFDDEFIERLVLLFNLPTALAFCKCALIWAYSAGNIEMADFVAQKYTELLRRRTEELQKVREEV